MTPLQDKQDKLRAALRETADEITAEAPPLRLTPHPRITSNGRGPHPRHRRWTAWTAPLMAAAVVVAIVVASLAVAGGVQHEPAATPAGLTAVPPYYVALTAPAGTEPNINVLNATAAEVRATATGAVLARVTVPRPYIHFAGVSAAADDRTFALVAEEKSGQLSRFYLLRFDPASGRASLQALPASFIAAGDEVNDMSLSPDGTLLATDIRGDFSSSPPDRLYMFDLATGSVRTWSDRGSVGFGSDDLDALSWTGDGKYLAFVGAGPSVTGAVRLLDVTAPGSDLLASSKPVASLPPGDGLKELYWHGGIITPGGQTVVISEELTDSTDPVKLRGRLLESSVATGQVTAVLADLNFLAGYAWAQVMYTNATGSVLVVSGLRKGNTAGVLHGDVYTPIPWSPRTITASW